MRFWIMKRMSWSRLKSTSAQVSARNSGLAITAATFLRRPAMSV